FTVDLLVHQARGHRGVGNGIDVGDVGTRLEGQVVGRLHVGAAHQVDTPGVRDDQLGTVSQPSLHPRGEDRVCVRRVGADQQDDVGLVDRREVLGAGRGAERLVEAVAGGGVADPGAGVDVVVVEGRTHHLLDDVDLL